MSGANRAAQAEKPVKAETVVISIDNKASDVLKLDAEGKTLKFDTKPGRFLFLSDEEAAKLSHDNRLRYQVELDHARETNGEDKEAQELQALIQASDKYSSATARLNVVENDPSERGKYEYALVQSSSIAHRQSVGWEVVTGKMAQSGLNKTGQGLHKSNSRGAIEGVLMRINKIQLAENIQKSHQGAVDWEEQWAQQNEMIVNAQTKMPVAKPRNV